MSEVNDKLLADIKRLGNEIKEQEDYFYSELQPKLMGMMGAVSARKFVLTYWDTYKQGRLKIKFARFKRRCARRRKDTIFRIEIRYKYRTVLLFEHNDFTKKGDLKTFHSCEWLSSIDTLCKGVLQTLQKEDYKNGLKQLKKRQKKLKAKCEDFKALCEE